MLHPSGLEPRIYAFLGGFGAPDPAELLYKGCPRVSAFFPSEVLKKGGGSYEG